MDQALAALHQANRRRLPVTLELCRHENQVALACRYPSELGSVIESQIYAQYPECRIASMSENLVKRESVRTWALELHLHRQLFPIKRFTQFEDTLNRVSSDPLTS